MGDEVPRIPIACLASNDDGRRSALGDAEFRALVLECAQQLDALTAGKCIDEDERAAVIAEVAFAWLEARFGDATEVALLFSEIASARPKFGGGPEAA